MHFMAVRRTLAALGILTVVLGLQGCRTVGKVDFVDLLTSGRDGWQRPARVIEALELAPGDRVAEIGAGDGYWLPWLSEAVGPTGRVFAVEVEPEKVQGLRDRVERERLDNVVVVFGEYEDPLLPDSGIDVAITCLTYHHIEDRPEYFSRLRSDLAPGGRVAHLDDRDDLGAPLRWLPSAGHTSNVAEMDAEMTAAGYRRTASFDFLLVQSFRVYVPGKPAVSLEPQLSGGS
jgi:ubiquinone/menaquinone biosynthesis C-methylase UbiE